MSNTIKNSNRIVGKVGNEMLVWEDGFLTGSEKLIAVAEKNVSEGTTLYIQGMKPIYCSIANIGDITSVLATFLVTDKNMEIVEAPQEAIKYINNILIEDPNSIY